ncbi:MAG TPA: DUF1846 family protein, partial [Clostridiales bacterium]|nr:DUF1846 family protein [Clostridiales bacterium]
YIETTKPLVIVTGPGPGSGKLATCLSQLYHDNKRGIKSGYAKFETFPIWNIPLKHPVNVAYEAATADLKDLNIIDPFHLETYGKTAVNYNRDVEIFPVLKRILERVSSGESIYKSPTDMGVNRAGFGIIDDEVVREAAKQEIIRRYFWYKADYAKGIADKDAYTRVEVLMEGFKLVPEDRRVVIPAREVRNGKPGIGKDNKCGAAIELKNGVIATGKRSVLMNATSSVILNAIKIVSGIPDNIHLLSPNVIESIQGLKKDILNEKNIRLNLEETMIALGISATTNPTAQLALSSLKELYGCEMHSTHILSSTDESVLHKLGINVTCDPNFPSEDLYIG